MGSTPSPPPPPPPSLSLSATAPVFRPSFPSRSSTPSLSSSLLFLPTGAAASTSTAAFPATRRHSDYPSSSSSSSSSPLPPPQLSFKTPQLGSAALWDPQDDDVSLGPNSIHGRRDSTWGSPLSFLSDLSTTTSAPNTPADGGRRPSLSSFSPESVPVERRFPEDQTVQAMAAKIAELSLQLSSSLSQLDELRAENLTLRAQHAPGGPLPPPPNLSRRGSVALSPVISRDDRCTMDAVYNGVAPPVQALPGGKLIRPPPEIAQDILLGTMDYRDFFALPGLHLAPPPISVEVFTIRVQWVVAVLAGEYPAKEGALKRAASALTDILNSEKRFSRRVVALLNVLATAASALAVRPQGNFLIQNAFGCGREARQAFFEIMRPDFKTIIPAQYGQHVVLKMIVRDDMRALIVDCLVELLGDREFLQTRGGTRVLEQALKSFSRDQCRFVYDKLSEVMNGHWLDCAVSINGCLVVQNLIELYPHNGDFSHQFLEEVLGGITQVAANSHGSFVLHKLLIHPDLRSQTLLAVFSSLDPLCAGPDVGRDALLEGAHLGCSSEEWGEWVGKVCDGISRVPTLVDSVQRPGGIGLLICALKETPHLLADRIRATLLDNTRLLRCTAPGREALSLCGSPGSIASSSLPPLAPWERPSPSNNHSSTYLDEWDYEHEFPVPSSAPPSTTSFSRHAGSGEAVGGGQARFGMTLGGRR